MSKAETETRKIGDVVVLISGGPRMTITDITGPVICCGYFVDCDFRTIRVGSGAVREVAPTTPRPKDMEVEP